MKYPDLFFFCLFATRLLVEKRLRLYEAEKLQENLARGARLLDGNGKRPYEFVKFRGMGRTAMSASLLVDKGVHFRFGKFGFGLLSRYRRRFGEISKISLSALMETIIEKHNEGEADMIYKASSIIGGIKFGKDLNSKNCVQVAQKIYADITGDSLRAQ